MKNAYTALNEHLAPVYDLRAAAAVLQWDQEVCMPPKGTKERSNQLSTLSEIAHGRFISPETENLIAALENATASAPYESDERSLARVVRRDYDQSAKIPSSLVAEQARLAAQSFTAWVDARERNDYAAFAPWLEKSVDLARKIADCIGYENHPYEALFFLYEPGITVAELDLLFAPLAKEIPPLLEAAVEKAAGTSYPVFQGTFDPAKQKAFTETLLAAIGFDFSRGRQDPSAHPFTTTFSSGDVRVTNRFSAADPFGGIFGALHEGGHALYEQGVPEKYDRTTLFGGTTLGVHESQSRLWENFVGRGHHFWKHYYPLLIETFPDALRGIALDDFVKLANRVEPGLIRVEADELSYNLHIFIRYDLEKRMIEGSLPVKELPGEWNRLYKALLGVTVPDDRDGCMQDVHWSHGSFGYFPTYTVGNIIAAQLFDAAKKALPSLEEDFSRGDFAPLLAWLRENIHVHGRKFTAPEMVTRVTNEKIDPGYLIRYLKDKFGR